MRILVFPFLLTLAACSGGPSSDVTTRATAIDAQLPPMNVFPAQSTPAPTRANSEMVRDFLDLTFKMESGRQLATLTRFEEPITVRVSGAAPASLSTDLAKLIGRLRSEAGIDISRVSGPGPANLNIEAVPSREMRRLAPSAACFVVPRLTSWADYKRHRKSSLVDWTTLERRETMAIFVKSDESPQELRDCLHEEIAQALGPVNDLYRLPDSVFNDDNMNNVLTGFDMLMLRAYYDPALRNGMSRNQVAEVLPGVLRRLNPRGEGRSPNYLPSTSKAWKSAVEEALGPRGSLGTRRAAAQRAVSIAQSEGWTDHRRGFSHYIVGRLSQSSQAETALAAFLKADAFYAQSALTEAHRAHVGVQLTAYALAAGQASSALEMANRHMPPLSRNQNAALLANLMMMKAEALELIGRPAEARNVRLDSLGWARYGFADVNEVRRRQAEVAALVPRRAAAGSGNG
ncbi:hypothetical protein PSA7680_00223 [Pseudoruegeria aquimaris]|uniref:ATP-dependent transcriptional regulator n=1 Tax=Pseudoruegeria aquimaris TaxID=393663 RepID=A0A1Y5RAP4_9RHOB|nr:DUF2927 domain-containing protein [Pseudoruegeria aquimaris]SLN12935.1 hypothetical protein PSA7680_00223 [Pseudoruegeria aquimaris]